MPRQIDIPDDREAIVITGEHGLLRGFVDYWNGQAPPIILSGAKSFPVDAETYEAEGYDAESSTNDRRRAGRALAWKIYNCKVSDSIRRQNEAERRAEAGEDVDPKYENTL